MLTAATASWNHKAMFASPKVENVLIMFFWLCKEQKANYGVGRSTNTPLSNSSVRSILAESS
jgi:hypothetical protein